VLLWSDFIYGQVLTVSGGVIGGHRRRGAQGRALGHGAARAGAEAALASQLERLSVNQDSAWAAAAAMRPMAADPHSVTFSYGNLGGAFSGGFVTEDSGHNARMVVRPSDTPRTRAASPLGRPGPPRSRRSPRPGLGAVIVSSFWSAEPTGAGGGHKPWAAGRERPGAARATVVPGSVPRAVSQCGDQAQCRLRLLAGLDTGEQRRDPCHPVPAAGPA